MPGPRMVEAGAFLGTVREVAPSRDALVRLDSDFASATGRAPRSLTRSITRAEASGWVSEKVVNALAAYLRPAEDRALFRGRCPRCGCYRRTVKPSESAFCDPCDRSLG